MNGTTTMPTYNTTAPLTAPGVGAHAGTSGVPATAQPNMYNPGAPAGPGAMTSQPAPSNKGPLGLKYPTQTPGYNTQPYQPPNAYNPLDYSQQPVSTPASNFYTYV